MKGASGMVHRVTFSNREEIDDGFGNTVSGDWQVFATLFAEIKHLKGGETVMASRLTGSHVQVIRIRASETAKQITTEFKATHKGVDFNIRDITPTEDRKWLDILAESGVAV